MDEINNIPVLDNQQFNFSPINETPVPIENNPVPQPKKNINIKIIFLGFFLLSLIGLGINFLLKKTNNESLQALPYENTVAAKNPREKFQQIITSNPVFTQMEASSVPTTPVDKEHDQGAQTMLSLKAALSNNDLTTESIKKQTLINIAGNMLTDNPEETQGFTLKSSLLQLLQNNGEMSLSDYILNGSIGSANFDDENQDGLHISLTQTDKNNSYLKVNMSDYLLIFINRIMNPDKPVSPQISFDTDEIWPFLGQYLHIPRSVELLKFGNSLNQKDQDILEIFREEASLVFDETIGNIESYIDITESQQENNNTTFTGTINPNKLANEVSNYFLKIQELKHKYLEDLKLLCESTTINIEEKNNCLTELSAPDISKDILITNFVNFLTFFEFQPIKATINNSSLAVENISFSFIFNNQIDAETGFWLSPIPFSQLSLSIITNSQNYLNKSILAPLQSVSFLSAGSNTDSFIDNSYQEETIQGDLYRENKQLLLSSYTDNKQLCGGIADQEYCLDISTLWSDYLNQDDNDNFLLLTQKNPNTTDYRATSINISQKVSKYPATKCVYPDSQEKDTGIKMAKYIDVTTKDNITLRLSEPKETYDLGSVYYYVCTEKDGNYYDATPYGKISINLGPLDTEELFQEIDPILSSLTFSNSETSQNAESLIKTPSPIPTIDYENKYSFLTPIEKTTSPSNTFVLFYGVGPGDPGVCYVTSEFLKKTYQEDDDAMFVIPSGYGVCITQNGCAVCNNKRLSDPSSDLSACAQQVCK